MKNTNVHMKWYAVYAVRLEMWNKENKFQLHEKLLPKITSKNAINSGHVMYP